MRRPPFSDWLTTSTPACETTIRLPSATLKRQGVPATGVMTVESLPLLKVSVLAFKVATPVSNWPFSDGIATTKR